MSSEKKSKMIFAKATALNFCAIVVYQDGDNLKVCDITESENIVRFIKDVEALARKHQPELLQYECSVYLDECHVLRNLLYKDNIRVRGYKSEGDYLNRIVSQSVWIENHVFVNEKFISFIDRMTSFNVSEPDKTNITLDILSDATKYLRRNFYINTNS
jgi:hypothetical protein